MDLKSWANTFATKRNLGLQANYESLCLLAQSLPQLC
jgi:hypothetical protein